MRATLSTVEITQEMLSSYSEKNWNKECEDQKSATATQPILIRTKKRNNAGWVSRSTPSTIGRSWKKEKQRIKTPVGTKINAFSL